jgi:hypothetical protein
MISIGAVVMVSPAPSDAVPKARPRGSGLPTLGSSETTLREAYGRSLNVVTADRRSRNLTVSQTWVFGLPAKVRFDVSARTRSVYRIEVSMTGLDRCHAYEAIIRRSSGKPDNAEWGTRAYELTWTAKATLPATHFWLYAYDGENTRCDVTFGPRA